MGASSTPTSRTYLSCALDNEPSRQFMIASGCAQHPAIQKARNTRADRIAESWPAHPHSRLLARAVLGALDAGTQDWLEHKDYGIDEAADTLASAIWDGLPGAGSPDSES